MSSEMLRFVAAVACVVAAATGVGAGAAGQAARAARAFFPDDPISRDDDTAMDASGLKELELSESFDFLINTFVSPGDREPIRAVNVNTLDEVPDSSWFTNRIGVRDLPIAEITRGPNKFERLDATDWVVVAARVQAVSTRASWRNTRATRARCISSKSIRLITRRWPPAPS